MKCIILVLSLASISHAGPLAPKTPQEALVILQDTQPIVHNMTSLVYDVAELVKVLEASSSTNESAKTWNEVHFKYREILKHFHDDYVSAVQGLQSCGDFFAQQHEPVYKDLQLLVTTVREKLSNLSDQVTALDQKRQKLIVLPLQQKLSQLIANMREFLTLSTTLTDCQDMLGEAVFDLQKILDPESRFY